MLRSILLRARLLLCTTPIVLTSLGTQAYVIQSQGWDGPGLGSANLTWYISSYSGDLTTAQQDVLVSQALAEWSQHAAIDFTLGVGPGAPNQIDFNLGATGVDTFSHWGWAYYPPDAWPENQAGDVYIDDTSSAPTWTAGGDSHDGTNWLTASLYHLLLHEIGHSLGLGHPVGPGDNLAAGAVMNPLYGFDNDFHPGHREFSALQPDDIAGLLSIYAARPGNVPAPPTLLLVLLGALALRMFRGDRTG